MRSRLTASVISCAIVVAGIVSAAAIPGQLREPPIPHKTGQSVSPSFEGWYPNADGTISLSFGYFNRNYEEVLDIPVGPNNRFDPGPADRGQPTHFLMRRQTGVFTVVVPKDFAADKRLTWTIVSGGETIAVPGHVRPEWRIDALKETTSGNTPPVVKLDADGKSGQGPGGTRVSRSALVGEPLALNAWVTDDGIAHATGGTVREQGRLALGVIWSSFRGAGLVTFARTEPAIVDGRATTTALFSEPGDYVLRLLAWDSSGKPAFVMAGGFQCCWTNAYVDVTVKPAARTAR
jgi:hypothetical protein